MNGCHAEVVVCLGPRRPDLEGSVKMVHCLRDTVLFQERISEVVVRFCKVWLIRRALAGNG